MTKGQQFHYTRLPRSQQFHYTKLPRAPRPHRLSARERKAQAGMGYLLTAIVATLLLLPFILFAIYEYFALRHRLVTGHSVIRIIDIRRAFRRATYGIVVMVLLLVLAGLLLPLAGEPGRDHQIILFVVLLFFCVGWLFVGVRTARALAVGLIGVIIDKDEHTISFGTDGVLRSFDLRTILDSIVPASMFTVPLASILNVSRQAGKSLLIHGEFGSRAITFSDKLRRDELLNVITSYRRFGDAELAGPGDYA